MLFCFALSPFSVSGVHTLLSHTSATPKSEKEKCLHLKCYNPKKMISVSCLVLFQWTQFYSFLIKLQTDKKRKCTPSEKYMYVYALGTCIALLHQCGWHEGNPPAGLLAQVALIFAFSYQLDSSLSTSSSQYPIDSICGSGQVSFLGNQAQLFQPVEGSMKEGTRLLMLRKIFEGARWVKTNNHDPSPQLIFNRCIVHSISKIGDCL